MDVFALVMYIFAFVCFVVAAAGNRLSAGDAAAGFGWLGLAFATLPTLVSTVLAVAGT